MNAEGGRMNAARGALGGQRTARGWRLKLAGVLTLALVGMLTLALPARAEGPPDSGPASAGQWYSTQLHLHGWSNHNAGAQPGSMQYHTAWAQAKGVDVLWWSDHNKMYVQSMDLPLNLAGATINATLDIAVPHPPGIDPQYRGWQIGWLDALKSGAGQTSAALNQGTLRMALQDPAGRFGSFTYRALNYQQRLIGGQSFVRPLVSDPLLTVNVARCDASSSADAFAEIRFGLSWHTDVAQGLSRPQELVYRLAPAGEPSSVVASSRVVTVTIPVAGGSFAEPPGSGGSFAGPQDDRGTTIQRSLLADAGLLPDGDDNAIQELTLRVGSRNNAAACLQLSDFSITSRQQDPAANVASQRPVAQRLQAAYGVVQHVGWEQNAGAWHSNPYLPRTTTLRPGWPDLYPSVFTPVVQAAGGLAALNHPFGADYQPILPDDQQEAMVQDRLSTLLPVRAWKMDLMEMYLERQGIDLAHHLKLWDLLAANGVNLCGIAASDQHGGPLTSPRTHMVTWINAPDPSQDALLAGLTACRAFFGRIDRFDGVLDLRLGPAVMGGSHPVMPGSGQLLVTAAGLPAGAQVRLVQVAQQPGTQLSYIVDHQPIDPSQPVAIDLSQPGFVRVELWSAGNEPIAFSNRIYLQHPRCDVNQDGAIDITDVQSVAGAFNQTVPPAPARYDLHPDGRIDVQDVTLAAQCWQER